MENTTESLITLNITGMTCVNCENKIQKKLRSLEGVVSATVSYNDAKARIVYDKGLIVPADLVGAIEKVGYDVVRSEKERDASSDSLSTASADKNSYGDIATIGIVLIAGYILISKTIGFNFIPDINENIGYGMLFVIGLFTSIHCMAMCGGINLSQTISYAHDDKNLFSKHKASILYNVGRVISYTIVGGFAGALGSAVRFTGGARGIVAVISGVFMLIMGLNMLGTFIWLRKLNPRMPRLLKSDTIERIGKSGPFYVGLLNGLMPCGPLQAMQLYALGTGSMLAGAMSMFLFSLGTVPLMFAFGATSAYLGKKFTAKMMKVSAVLVMVLGVIMLHRGFSLSGIDITAIFPF